MGEVDLFLIYDYDGEWEEEWRPLQLVGAMTDLFTYVDHEVIESAIRGWSPPLAKAMRAEPKGCLLKLPVVARKCANQGGCPLFIAKDCRLLAPKMPWCFEPVGFDPALKELTSEIIRLWRDGVYVVVVKEVEPHAR